MNQQKQRYWATEQKIVEAFYSLLAQKSFSEIKAKEIIAVAQVNRSTFYAHFLDKYDLLDKAENYMLEELYEVVSQQPKEFLWQNDTSQWHAYYRRMAEKIYQQREKLKILFLEQTKSRFINKITNHMEMVWKEDAFLQTENPNNRYYISGLVHLVSGILQTWLQNDCAESPERFAKIMQVLGDNLRLAILSDNYGYLSIKESVPKTVVQ